MLLTSVRVMKNDKKTKTLSPTREDYRDRTPKMIWIPELDFEQRKVHTNIKTSKMVISEYVKY